MKSKQILFSTPMVQAIFAGRKTQTRRKAHMTSRHLRKLFNGEFEGESGRIYKCPYGKVGTPLWVKETFYAYGHWVKNGTTKTGKQKRKFVRDKSLEIRYEDDKPDVVRKNSYRGVGWYKRSSLFMERDMARIWVRITNFRVERLQDISEEDAIKEGIEELKSNGIPHYRNYGKQLVAKEFNFFCSPVNSFRSLWESINGENSWKQNPWVWVIEFDRIEKPSGV